MSMKSKCHQYELTVSCAAGLEQLVATEVKGFGGTDIERAKGLVTFRGGLEVAYRTCLWSRFASRVLLTLNRFPASNEEMVYDGALQMDWSAHLGLQNSFAVDCSLSNSTITHSRFAALRVKDGLVDKFRQQCNERPSVELTRPDLRFRLHIHNNEATISLDLSGESLHLRGYRTDGGGAAPLKESLAAAIVTLAGWETASAQPVMLLDPMCGSGTLLIEAALIYGDVAPGLSRSYFGFLGWKQHDEALWSTLVDEAIAREEQGLEREWPVILGYDADPRVVALARKNVESAGLEDRITVRQGQLAHLRRPAAHGLLVTNPPYGERLAEKEEAEQLHRALGTICRRELAGWRLGIFTASPEFGDRMGMEWEQRHRLYNGPINCRLFCGPVANGVTTEFVWQLSPEQGPEGGREFANRLRKNMKQLLKWAKRGKLSCFRVYDRDLQEYNISVDIYGKWIHVQEYAPPATVKEGVARERFNNALAQIRHLFGVHRERVFIKTRRKQKGKAQYQKQSSKRKMHTVQEGDCSLLVNFTDYLDTGLFLDHRNTRLRLGQLAKGKRFLNLFAYTGTATVHAAMGGAETTTSVDLSANYLNWARMNLALNGFGGLAHQTVPADCMQWLQEDRGTYDLIFVDPPTFSNTKKSKRVFDVQDDHRRLIELAMQHLAPDGLLIFSTNYRQFKLDPYLESTFMVKNISKSSVPYDFSRNKKIHQCWEIRP